jgi:hypothetical protein
VCAADKRRLVRDIDNVRGRIVVNGDESESALDGLESVINYSDTSNTRNIALNRHAR